MADSQITILISSGSLAKRGNVRSELGAIVVATIDCIFLS